MTVKTTLRAGGLAALLLAMADPTAAEPDGFSLRRFLYDDAVATLHIRSYYLDRSNPSPPNNVAWAGGGWPGYETGWLRAILRLGAVAYTTQPLWAPDSTDGTLLLKAASTASGRWARPTPRSSCRTTSSQATASTSTSSRSIPKTTA